VAGQTAAAASDRLCEPITGHRTDGPSTQEVTLMLVVIAVNVVLCLIVFAALLGGLTKTIRSAHPRPARPATQVRTRAGIRRHAARTPA
jgi:hypothetical protein